MTNSEDDEDGGSDLLPGLHKNGDIDWPFTFPLRRSIEAMGETYTALTLQEPLGDLAIKHRLLTVGLTDENMIPILSALTAAPNAQAGIPEASLKKMALADLMRITTILERFFRQAVG